MVIDGLLGDSSYFSLCGNAGTSDIAHWDGFQNAMCSKWLHPAPSDDFPTFKKWVVYGRWPLKVQGFCETLLQGPKSGSLSHDC